MPDLENLRSKWKQILNALKLVAEEARRGLPECDAVEAAEEAAFKRDIIHVIFFDSVIAGLSTRYDAAYKIDDMFCFLWRYLDLAANFDSLCYPGT